MRSGILINTMNSADIVTNILCVNQTGLKAQKVNIFIKFTLITE